MGYFGEFRRICKQDSIVKFSCSGKEFEGKVLKVDTMNDRDVYLKLESLDKKTRWTFPIIKNGDNSLVFIEDIVPIEIIEPEEEVAKDEPSPIADALKKAGLGKKKVKE